MFKAMPKKNAVNKKKSVKKSTTPKIKKDVFTEGTIIYQGGVPKEIVVSNKITPLIIPDRNIVFEINNTIQTKGYTKADIFERDIYQNKGIEINMGSCPHDKFIDSKGIIEYRIKAIRVQFTESLKENKNAYIMFGKKTCSGYQTSLGFYISDFYDKKQVIEQIVTINMNKLIETNDDFKKYRDIDFNSMFSIQVPNGKKAVVMITLEK